MMKGNSVAVASRIAHSVAVHIAVYLREKL